MSAEPVAKKSLIVQVAKPARRPVVVYLNLNAQTAKWTRAPRAELGTGIHSLHFKQQPDLMSAEVVETAVGLEVTPVTGYSYTIPWSSISMIFWDLA